MFIQFLIEDQSGEILLEEVMKKYNEERTADTVIYKIKAYRGIGGFKKGKNIENIISEKLLTDLPKRLRAFNTIFMNNPEAALFIIMDNDRRDTEMFRAELEKCAEDARIKIDHVFCIAVEEMEAWLLGDVSAIKLAYPKLEDRINTKSLNYQQDSICGTWEVLADMLSKGGRKELQKKYSTPKDIGIRKAEWAKRIGSKMQIRNNKSPSFNFFINELDSRCYVKI